MVQVVKRKINLQNIEETKSWNFFLTHTHTYTFSINFFIFTEAYTCYINISNIPYTMYLTHLHIYSNVLSEGRVEKAFSGHVLLDFFGCARYTEQLCLKNIAVMNKSHCFFFARTAWVRSRVYNSAPPPQCFVVMSGTLNEMGRMANRYSFVRQSVIWTMKRVRVSWESWLFSLQ